jgi:hypothetical protein
MFSFTLHEEPALDYAGLPPKDWRQPDGKPFALTHSCISKMLKALPDTRGIDENRIIEAILGEARMVRISVDWSRNRVSAGKRKAYWAKFARQFDPAIGALKTLLASKDELVAFRLVTEGYAKPQEPSAIPSPRWTVERELADLLDTMKWARTVALAAQTIARTQIERKPRPAEDRFLEWLEWLYFDVTGKRADTPVYHVDREIWRGKFLDFVFPAMNEIFSDTRGAVATRIKRLYASLRKKGVRSASTRGRPPKRGTFARERRLLGAPWGVDSEEIGHAVARRGMS